MPQLRWRAIAAKARGRTSGRGRRWRPAPPAITSDRSSRSSGVGLAAPGASSGTRAMQRDDRHVLQQEDGERRRGRARSPSSSRSARSWSDEGGRGEGEAEAEDERRLPGPADGERRPSSGRAPVRTTCSVPSPNSVRRIAQSRGGSSSSPMTKSRKTTPSSVAAAIGPMSTTGPAVCGPSRMPTTSRPSTEPKPARWNR